MTNVGGLTPNDFLYYLKSSKTVYNGHSGLKNWRNALNRLRNGSQEIINLQFIGDSITEGISSSDIPTKSFVGIIRNTLKNKFGDVGEGLVPVYTPTTGTLRWTFTGTWVDNVGITGRGKSTTEALATADLSFNGTGIVVLLYKSPSSGTFKLYVDGTEKYSGSAAGTETYAIPITINDLEPGDHVLRFEKVNTSVVIVLGAYPLKGTAGIRVNMAGRASQQSVTLSEARSLYASINAFNPTLTVISCISNDYKEQRALSTYKSNIQTIITRAKQYGDVLLTSIGMRYYATEQTIPQRSYDTILKELCKENNIAFWDAFAYWKKSASYSIQRKLMEAATQHPTDLGYDDIGKTWLKVAEI